jgi:hypothetical protein
MNENRWYVEQRPEGHCFRIKGGSSSAGGSLLSFGRDRLLWFQLRRRFLL